MIHLRSKFTTAATVALMAAAPLAFAGQSYAASMKSDMSGMQSGDMQSGDMMKHKTKMVGGAAMYPNKNIVENAVHSKDHTTLVAAVKAAGLVDTLSGPGPFTVFAPTNEAFKMLPAGTVETLLKPENKAMLTKVLTYHVVPGEHDAANLVGLIQKGGGKAELKTVEGDTLTVTKLDGKTLGVTDDKGQTAKITIRDVYQSNGVIHVVNKVLMP